MHIFSMAYGLLPISIKAANSSLEMSPGRIKSLRVAYIGSCGGIFTLKMDP